MNLLYRGIFLFFFLLTITPSLVKAQDWEYGVSIGTSGYMGEYNQNNIFKFNSLAGSVGAKYNFNPTWGIRGDLSGLGIKWYDGPDNLKRRILSDVSVMTEFNFFKFEPNRKKNAFTPYVFAGVGSVFSKMINENISGFIDKSITSFPVFPLSPSLSIIDKDGRFLTREEVSTQTQGYGNYSFKYTETNKNIVPVTKPVIPFGAGFKYNLKGALSIDARLTYRMTASDKLDDNVGPLPIKKDENPGKDKVKFIDKVNATDSYMTFQIGITYMIFKLECPSW